MYALGGNGSLFISKENGKVSSFRTGLSINGMINEYEELHKIWELYLTADIYADVKKPHDIREIFRLSMGDIAEYKRAKRTLFKVGTHERLSGMLDDLNKKGI